MVKLACTSKKYYSITMPVLQKRIAIKVMFWTHIPNAICRLESLLSIAQKKKLWKKGKYPGQQRQFSKHLDPDVVPACVGYVRQIIIGTVSSGYKRIEIVLHYLEQVLKNVDNLEVFSTTQLTKSVIHTAASRARLTAS